MWTEWIKPALVRIPNMLYVTAGILVAGVVVLCLNFGKRNIVGQLLDWPLRAEVWGTAGQWVASFLTLASLGVAFYLIYRDRVHKEQENVVKAFCWIESDYFKREPYFINTSDQPVVRPILVLVPKPLDQIKKLQEGSADKINMARSPYLSHQFRFKIKMGQEETTTFRKDDQAGGGWFIPEMPTDHYEAFVKFTDASGVDWARAVPGGRVLSSGHVAELEVRRVRLQAEFDSSAEAARELEEAKRDKSEDIAKEAGRD